MPTRLLKESLRTSKSLGDLPSAEPERLFFRLITTADDFGRFECDPVLVRAACFPRMLDRVTVSDVSVWLQMLADASMLKFYEIDGKLFGFFVNWKRHQGPPRAKRSRFPEPCSESIRKQLHANSPESESESDSESESESEEVLRVKSEASVGISPERRTLLMANVALEQRRVAAGVR